MSCSNCGGSGKISKEVVTHLVTCPCCQGRSYGCKCGKKGCRYQWCVRGKIYIDNSTKTEMRQVDCNKCNGSGAKPIPKRIIKDYYIDSDDDDDDNYYEQFETEYEKRRKKEQQNEIRRQKLMIKQKQIEKQKQLELEKKEQMELNKALAQSMKINHKKPDIDLQNALKESTNEQEKYQHYLQLQASMNGLNVNIEAKEQNNDKGSGFDNEGIAQLLQSGMSVNELFGILNEKAPQINTEETKEDDVYDDANNICSICLQEYKYGEKKLVLRCMHVFHDICANQWIDNMKHRKCPICRTNVDP